ncbi:MAG: lysylphosphatidylglycerol synthase transmembrane domain-containing protein [Candidatus Spechtbacteria bacterium]|nr:lysylphosphatidylglycerol synthase transmembrane domain-containing protein [Candidatus Spechtbacteria bacterium]
MGIVSNDLSMSMRKFTIGIILFITGAVLTAILVIKIDFGQVLSVVFSINPLGFLALLLLTFAGILATNLRGQIILRSQGVEFPFWRLFGVWLAGNAFSYIAPHLAYLGGEGIKIYLLNQKFGISKNKTASFIVIDKIVDLTSFLFMIVMGAAVFVYYIGPSDLTRSVIWSVSVIGVVFLIFALFYALVFQNKKFISRVLKALFLHKTRVGYFIQKTEDDIIDFFSMRSKFMWQSFASSMLTQAAFLLRHILLIYLLGRGIQFSASVMSLGAFYAGFMMPVPGALGVQEGIQSIIFSALGWGGEQGLALSLILRTFDITVVSLGVLILLRQGIGLMTSGALYMINTSQNNGEKENNNKQI